jgi:YggT family protein
MHDLVLPLIEVISILLGLYKWVILIYIVMSWLVMANVVNTRNRAVYLIMDAVTRMSEPALSRIRRVLPNTGMIDLSAIVLLLLLYLAQRYLDILASHI